MSKDALDTIDAGYDVDFDLFTDAERAEYLALMEQVLGKSWDLAPKQEYADAVWGKVDWLLFGGSAGGGKSDFALHHVNRLSLEHPDHHALLIRRSIPELRRSLIIRHITRIKRFGIPARYRKLDGQAGFQYENGSLIECGHCANEEDTSKYLSAEYDLIIIDEATQLLAEMIMQLQARLRTTREKARGGVRPHLGLFTNPGGVSHAWLYDLMVIPTGYGRKIIVLDVSNGIEQASVVREYEAPCDPRTATVEQIYGELIPWAQSLQIEADPMNHIVVGFVPSKATDNPFIEPSYIKNLNALPERRRRQLRDGDWDVFEGQYFHEFVRSAHVIRPFPVPRGWQRARGIDYGTTNPYCCFDDQTEVLTTDGWRTFDNIEGLAVATVDPVSKAMEFQHPTAHIGYEYSGDLIVSEPTREGVNFAVTPNHRMVTYDTRQPAKWSFCRADAMASSHMIPKASGPLLDVAESSLFILPKAGGHKTLTPTTKEAFARFLGLVIAEGSLHQGSVRVGQSKNVDAVREVFAALGWEWKEWLHSSGAIYFEIFSVDLIRWMAQRGMGTKSQFKRVPREVMEWNTPGALLDGLMIGDGTIHKVSDAGAALGSSGYHTCSPGLADDVQEIACRLGMHATITRSRRRSGYGDGPWPDMYLVRMHQAQGARISALPIERRHYDGMVRCVTVPNGTLIVRRQGRMMVSGNCLWGAWDEDGNCYIYREDYEALLTPSEQAKRVVTRSVGVDEDGKEFIEKFSATVADPSVFSNHRGAGKAVADLWRDAGLSVTRAKNQRVAGWANVRQYLWDPEKQVGDGKLGGPRLYIFDHCHNLARTLPLAQQDNNNAEDIDTHGDDHALDALRYLLAVRPLDVVKHRPTVTKGGADGRFAEMMRARHRRELAKKGRSWN